MKLSTIKRRAERYGLMTSADKYYVDDTSGIIKELKKEGKDVFLGIQNNKGIYTVIGSESIYYVDVRGRKGAIFFTKFIKELEDYNARIGDGFFQHKFLYKYITLSNGDKLWLHNVNTVGAIWNTVLWLQKNLYSESRED